MHDGKKKHLLAAMTFYCLWSVEMISVIFTRARTLRIISPFNFGSGKIVLGLVVTLAALDRVLLHIIWLLLRNNRLLFRDMENLRTFFLQS